MIRIISFITLLMLLGGCSYRNSIVFHDSSEETKLDEAIHALQNGNEPVATRLLEEICSNKGVEGVSDEAMFRLSLLGLRHHKEPGKLLLVQSRLLRLRSEYPGSVWTKSAWPLMEYIDESERLRGELRSLKDKNSSLSKENREQHYTIQQLQNTNQTLTKDNKELGQRIEKLKQLDMELEQKKRR